MTLASSSSAPSRSPPAASICASATAASARPGSSSSARRRFASLPDGDQRVGLGGHDPVEEALDLGRRQRADELVDDLAVLERLDGRDRLDPEGLREARVGVGVDLDELDLAGALVDGLLDHGPERAARAAPLGPEVDDHGLLVRALDDVALEGLFSGVDGHAARIVRMDFRIDADGVTLAGEEAGTGVPVVLLHGLTATRRYVVMGSRALERSGHRVIAYDARAHGQSDPARDPQDYGYERLADDLLAVLDDRGIERAVLAGASMGAHTLTKFALAHPERVAGLVIMTPAYDPEDRRPAPWIAGTGSPRACAKAASRASSRPTARRTCPRSGTRRSTASCTSGSPPTSTRRRSPTRCRPSRARARSSTGSDLRAIDAPTVIVASRDEVDPEHPYAIGERYAEAIPGARLVSEEPGASPLAWQGAQVSKVISEVADSAASAP